jgi:hypothetical protein
MTSGERHWLDYAVGGFAFLAALGGITAAVFTGWQAWVAQDTEKRQLRSYVGISPGDVTLQEGTPAVVVINFKNFGQTPAYSVTLHGRAEQLPYPLPTSFVFPDYSPQSILAEQLTVYPQSQYSANGETPSPMSSEQILAVREGKTTRIYAFGTVFYKDIFGDTHSTDFCYNVIFKEGYENGAEFCPRHNIGNR